MKVLAEPREPVQEVRERFGVGRRCSAVAGDEQAGLLLRQKLLRVDVGQRRDPEPRLTDQLRQYSAGAEGDERAERRVLNDACEQLDPALDHGLDDHRRPDPLRGRPDGGFVGQVQRDASRLGLVRTRFAGLDDDRHAELASRPRPPRRTDSACSSGTTGMP